MKADNRIDAGNRNRGRGSKLPLALFHAPLPGEEVDLFSDRTEDLIEYESIVHEFESIHDADSAG